MKTTFFCEILKKYQTEGFNQQDNKNKGAAIVLQQILETKNKILTRLEG